MRDQVSSTLEQELGTLTKHILDFFNKYGSNESQPIDYVSDPVTYEPNEIQFDISVEHLGRIAREQLLRLIPVLVSGWEARSAAVVAALQLGEDSEPLNQDERKRLHEAIDGVHSSFPVEGKRFVIGGDLPDWFRQSLRSRLHELGATIEDGIEEGCDYFVSDSDELTVQAMKAGVRNVVDSITVRVMVGS